MASVATQTALDALSPAPTPKLTTRRKLLLSGIADGLSISDAGRSVGMSPRNAWDAYEQVKEQLPSILDANGVTVDAIARKLADQLNATKTLVATQDGRFSDTIEVADNAAIGKAIETAARIRRMLDSDKGSINIGAMNIVLPCAAPGWSGQSPAQLPTINADASVHNAIDTVHLPIGNTVHPPSSTIEGTGIEGGRPAHIRQVKKGTLKQRTSTRRKGRSK